MILRFATCNRDMAVKFLKQGLGRELHEAELTDLLGLIEQDIIRVTDPNYHALAIVPGKRWDESYRDRVITMCEELKLAQQEGDRYDDTDQKERG